MDIEKAIQIENEYIQNRLNNIDDSLIDKFSSLKGFTSLDEYFKQKTDFLIKKSAPKLITCKVPEINQTLSTLFQSKEAHLLIVPSNQYFLYHGNEPYNENFCKEHNIYVCEIGHQGGTIVVSPKDISFGIMIPDSTGIDEQWILQGYFNIFQKYGYNVKIDNNDILIDNKKILGGATFRLNHLFIHVCNISFEDTTNLINEICFAPREKQPGYIQTPLTRDILIKEVALWLQAQ